MNICFHIVLLICILQVLAHFPGDESKSHKVARNRVKKLKSINTSGLKNRLKGLAHPGKIRRKNLKSVDIKQKNEHHVKKVAQKRRKGKKKQLKNHGSGLRGSVKDKTISAIHTSNRVGQKRTRTHRRKIQKSVAKKGQFKTRQNSKRRIRPGQKKNTPRHNRILPKNGAWIKNKNKRNGRRRGVKIGTKTSNQKPLLTNQQLAAVIHKETLSTTKIVSTPKYEQQAETAKILASKPEENKQKQDAPLVNDYAAMPKETPEAIKTVKLNQKATSNVAIDLTKKEQRKMKVETPKNQELHTKSKIPSKEAEHDKGKVVKSITPKPNIQAKTNQVTKMSQTAIEDDFLKFFRQSKTELTTTEKPTIKQTTKAYRPFKGILTDEEIRLYGGPVYEADLPGLCRTRHKIAQKLFDRGYDFAYFPHCSYDGLFETRQCNSGGSCWCADVKTGEKVPGSCKEPALNLITITEPDSNEISNSLRLLRRKKERARLRKIQKEKAFKILFKSCNFLESCVIFETLLQGAPELPRKIIEAYTGGNAAGNHGQDYQQAFDILKKLRLDSHKCEDIISNLPLLQPYMERFSESCEARNNQFDEVLHADPLFSNS